MEPNTDYVVRRNRRFKKQKKCILDRRWRQHGEWGGTRHISKSIIIYVYIFPAQFTNFIKHVH